MIIRHLTHGYMCLTQSTQTMKSTTALSTDLVAILFVTCYINYVMVHALTFHTNFCRNESCENLLIISHAYN